nr:MAG TPA: hypothetical protein [Caudoviricetes sp.]
MYEFHHAFAYFLMNLIISNPLFFLSAYEKAAVLIDQHRHH